MNYAAMTQRNEGVFASLWLIIVSKKLLLEALPGSLSAAFRGNRELPGRKRAGDYSPGKPLTP